MGVGSLKGVDPFKGVDRFKGVDSLVSILSKHPFDGVPLQECRLFQGCRFCQGPSKVSITSSVDFGCGFPSEVSITSGCRSFQGVDSCRSFVFKGVDHFKAVDSSRHL